MHKPTIHMNGTSAEELVNLYRDAVLAIDKAKEALARAAPHGRDYYPQGDTVIHEAMGEHFIRRQKLADVQHELEELWEHCAEHVKG